jgi:carnitine 3-dehydrogenase
MAKPVERTAVVGAGVIGSGWAARFLGAGLDVAAWDPAPNAEHKARVVIEAAWPAMSRRGVAPSASPSRFTFHAKLEDCVAGADLVQESAPEREILKQDLLGEIDAANPTAIVASSTSGLCRASFRQK